MGLLIVARMSSVPPAPSHPAEFEFEFGQSQSSAERESKSKKSHFYRAMDRRPERHLHYRSTMH